MNINIKGRLYSLDEPKVMGILNLTPDSFYDGGQHADACAMRKRIDEMVMEGVDIIDVGGCSTRPGSADVSAEEEWKRIEPALRLLAEKYPEIPVSVDTFRSCVARRAVEMGAAIINDISGGTMDNDMFNTVAELRVPYVLSHIQGTPKDMQQQPTYGDVVAEVMSDLSDKVLSLRKLGVADIIIDLGFGFGKTLEHNFTLLKHLKDFSIFELPVLVGVSRKSMIQKVLGVDAKDSLNGTTVLNTIAAASGSAHILRVHDVGEARECLRLVNFLNRMK